MKDKYGETGAMKMLADGEESSSTSESEDEDGEVSCFDCLLLGENYLSI